ncbi:MAG: PAS domain-containing protein [Bacteroidales bacterium]|nr:PAS domain-containing protein [Bacteroidales bacterium]
MTSKTPSYEQLLALNQQYKEQVLKLKEEVNLLRKSFLPEESYYKDRFYRITENVNDVVYRLALPEFRYEYISPQSRELFGYEPEDFYKSPLLIRRLIHPSYFRDFLAHWRGLLKGEAPEYYEIKIIKKNGEVRWMQQKNLVIRNKKGQAVAIEGIVTDITNRKLTEEALINSEAQKNAILNNLPHLAWLKDCDGKYLSVNESFSQSVGKSVEEIIGKTDYDIYPGEIAQRYRDEDLQIILTRKQFFLEEQQHDKWFESFRAPIFDTSGEVIGITGISLEISTRKQNEEEVRNYGEKLAIQNVKLKLINDELKSAKEKAEESDKLKSAFLANMSHEIRTPMNAILGFATLIRNRVLTEMKRKQYIDLINSNCRQLLHIITDIIDISKIEAGQISVYDKNFNLNKVLNELYLSYSNQIEVLNKKIRLQYTPGLSNEDSSLFTDKVRLEQILSNLLSNALKFTETGTIEFGYFVDRRRDIRFFVRDTGIGMSDEEQKVIFDRFRQVSTSYNKLYGGTGLGLSICKGLTERLGGKIWVESEYEKGSSFYFTIPYKPGIQIDYREEIDYDLEYNWKGKTILIAEDEDVNYNLLETVLSPTQARIIRAKTGIEAIERVEDDEQINLVLMDIKMPDMNGFEATRRIKDRKMDLPIIAQTAYAMSTDEENCIRSGCDDYLPKPLRIDTLLKKVDQYLRIPLKTKKEKGIKIETGIERS